MFISGCSSGSGPSSSISSADAHKGSDGIIMEFMDNAPSDEIYEGSEFYASTLVQNKGAFDVKKGYLVLGVEQGYISAENNGEMYNLNGKSISNILGGQEVFEFKLRSGKIDKQSEQHKTNIFLTTCYEYQTDAGADVCIDPDFYGMNPLQKACEVKDSSFKDQGAPVAVTKIEQGMLQEGNLVKPEFIIYVQNKGKGAVIDSSKVKDVCSSTGLDYKAWNTIYVEAYLFGKQLDCKPKSDGSKRGYIRLKGEEDFVKCVDEEGIERGGPAYTTPLKIVLNYGYAETISKEIVVKREVGY